MMKYCQKINLQEQQRNRNAIPNFVNLIRTSTVSRVVLSDSKVHKYHSMLVEIEDKVQLEFSYQSELVKTILSNMILM